MDALWQDMLTWGQTSSLNTIILVALCFLVVSAVITFAFKAIKVGIAIVIVLLLLGVSPTVMTSWVSSHMDAKNFGAAKIENANGGLLSLPTDWKVTAKDGKEYICKPDLTPEGIGGLTCGDVFYPSSAVKTAIKTDGKYSVLLANRKLLAPCGEVKEGYACPSGSTVTFKYTSPK